MTLDGSLSGRKYQGKYFRPVSTDYATQNFPALVVEIAMGRVKDSSVKVSGPDRLPDLFGPVCVIAERSALDLLRTFLN